MKRSFKRRFWVLLSLVTKVPRRRQHVKGVPRLRRGDGDADCHTSDVGHWFAMTTLWQFEVRRETDSHASLRAGRDDRSEGGDWLFA